MVIESAPLAHHEPAESVGDTATEPNHFGHAEEPPRRRAAMQHQAPGEAGDAAAGSGSHLSTERDVLDAGICSQELHAQSGGRLVPDHPR